MAEHKEIIYRGTKRLSPNRRRDFHCGSGNMVQQHLFRFGLPHQVGDPSSIRAVIRHIDGLIMISDFLIGLAAGGR